MNKSFTVYTGGSIAITEALRASLYSLGCGNLSSLIDNVKSLGHRFEEGQWKSHEGYITQDIKVTTPAIYYNGEFASTHPHFDALTQLGDLVKYLGEREPIVVCVDGRSYEVTSQKNGDVIVGCTLVPSATFEQIVQLRKEAIESKRH